RALSVSASVAEAFHALYAGSEHVVWLDSAGERGSGTSVLASGEPTTLTPGSELDSLRERLNSRTIVLEPAGQSAPLGFIGVLAYDIAQENLDIPGVASRRDIPTSRGLWVTRSLEFHHSSGEVVAWGLSDDDGFELWCEQVEETLASPAPAPAVTPAPPRSVTWRDGSTHYRQMIEQALDAIREGEVYQICLTTEVSIQSTMADWELHALLRESSPTHHQGLLRLGEYSLVSASPETFLTIDPHGVVTTRPIKGTRPRGATAELDAALARELLESDKERAENLMIVDLMRNDLQRVCETGSVNVTGLFEVETYSSVHQLVSTITGTLRADCDGIDALRACFPAGSMTGAPKHRAVTLLAQWESGPRGVYSGAWGWWRLDGSMEWAMTIRSAVIREGQISIGVGGGITWSSQPHQEIAEVGHKATRLLEALGASADQYS
ncbi:MAG: anthranilate synthase component I family protein, partial [Pontimonas sp.]